MSGGSLNYVFGTINDAAYNIEQHSTNVWHTAFAAHLRLVATALHDLEWVWSGDYAPGDEMAAIQAVVQPHTLHGVTMKQLEQAIADAQGILTRLKGA